VVSAEIVFNIVRKMLYNFISFFPFRLVFSMIKYPETIQQSKKKKSVSFILKFFKTVFQYRCNHNNIDGFLVLKVFFHINFLVCLRSIFQGLFLTRKLIYLST